MKRRLSKQNKTLDPRVGSSYSVEVLTSIVVARAPPGLRCRQVKRLLDVCPPPPSPAFHRPSPPAPRLFLLQTSRLRNCQCKYRVPARPAVVFRNTSRRAGRSAPLRALPRVATTRGRARSGAERQHARRSASRRVRRASAPRAARCVPRCVPLPRRRPSPALRRVDSDERIVTECQMLTKLTC